MKLITLNLTLILGLALSGCNSERSKTEKELSNLNSKLDSLKNGFTEISGELWPNEFIAADKLTADIVYRSTYEADKNLKITYVKQNEEGIIAYVDTTGELTIEIHKNLNMNPSSQPGDYLQYLDVNAKAWKYVRSCVAAFRYEVIGDSTFIKQVMNQKELSSFEKANLEAHGMDTNGIKIDASAIRTEQVIGVFRSGSSYVRKNNLNETGLDEFINDVGEQIKNNPSAEIIINYGYYTGGASKENNYVLNQRDKKIISEAYELYKHYKLVIACKNKLASIK